MKTIIKTLLMLCMLTSADLLHAETVEQTTCPVMEGTPVDRSLYTEYQGKRVYFCCKLCIQTFSHAPEKYISKLPQFSETASVEAHSNIGHTRVGEHIADKVGSGGGSQLYSLVKPLGVATYLSLVITVLLGLVRRKLHHRFLIIHRSFAVLAIVLATAHAILILILH